MMCCSRQWPVVCGATWKPTASRRIDVNIRVMVPVSVRPPGDFDRLGNRFGLVILSLPVGVRDPQRRLMVLKRRMDVIKSTPEALVAFGILNLMGLTPIQVEKIIMAIFAAKVTGVMTNVPGPRQPLYLAGRQLKGLMFWVPAPGNLALGLSILSYAGEVRIGVATDAGLIPDPEGIVAGFQAELDEMRGWLQPPGPAALPRARCQATTQAGAACKNLALPGTTLCRVHSHAAGSTQ